MPDNRSRDDLYEKLAKAEKQVENGELLGDEDVFKNLNEKYIDDKEIDEIAKKILEKHKAVFEELSKGENREYYLKLEADIFKGMSLDEIYDEAKKHWENKE